MSEGLKAVFSEHFREYVENSLGEAFDGLGEVLRSKYMSRFFAERVLAPRNPGIFPTAEEDLQACVVDGKGDQGIDFIARESGVVSIIQAKYSGGRKQSRKQREEPTDFDSFRNALQRLWRFRTLEMSEPLREVAAEIEWDRDKFQLYYITLRQLAANQANIANWNVGSIPDVPDLLERSELYLLDESKLNQELRDTLSLEKAESRRIDLIFSGNRGDAAWVKLGSAGERTSYVGRVGAAQLAELFTRERSRLFSLNIRNYIGDTATNKAIRKTALEDSENFFFFNNGISALAESIEEDPKDSRILHCHNLSIVNGAQTVRSLHKAHVGDPARARGVQVLLRLTETTAKKTSVEQDFLDNLTKYNNTQNAIKVSDFRSNDKIQHDIKDRFYALPSVKGKKFAYKRKRSGPGERDIGARNDTTIGMEEFTKTLYAFLFGPDDVYGGTSHVFDATSEGGYAKLFGDNGQILPSLSKETFEYYAGIWFVCNYARELWRAESRKSKHGSLERRWMFFYALGEALRACYSDPRDLRVDLQRLSSPSWTGDGPDGKIQKVIERLSKLSFKALKEAYGSASNAGDVTFTHRNWFRSPTTLRTITDKVADSWSLLSEYANDYRLPRPR